MYLFSNTNIFGLETVDLTVYSIAIGVFFAFFAYWFLQNVVGKLVRRIAKKAIGEENAKTLCELDRNNALNRFLLRDGSTLRRMISCVGDALPKAEGGKADFTQAKFFVTAENSKKALHRYPRKISAWWLALVFFLAAGVSFGATYLVPIILDLFSK